MQIVQENTTASIATATTGRPVVYDKNGIGFAELFATEEHPAVAAETRPWWICMVMLAKRLG
jgi:hypothetical protein